MKMLDGGLEILAASAAMHTHINILQEEKIWNSRCNDFSELDVMIVWSKQGAQLCDWPELPHDTWEMSAESSLDMEAPEPVRQVIKVLGGRPQVCDKKKDKQDTHESSHSDSDSDADVDLKKLYIVKQKSVQQRRVPDTECPSCDFKAVRGVDLYGHIKDMHPMVRKYECWDCTKRFHTDHDQLNHMNSVHCANIYHCTVCLFSAPVESQIHLHVCTHSTKKFACHVCDAQLSSKVTLHRHALLHAATGEHWYSHCDKSYASRLILSVHVKGIHGSGYKCPNCESI